MIYMRSKIVRTELTAQKALPNILLEQKKRNRHGSARSASLRNQSGRPNLILVAPVTMSSEIS